MRRTRVKICCISSVEEARLAVACGADALGLVSSMPSGPGVISEKEIRNIADTIPPGVASFLLTSLQDVEEIIAQQHRCATNTIQLVDELRYGSHDELRSLMPGVAIVQVLHVRDESTVDEALSLQRNVDAILLDSGNPDLAVKELGGTGRVHDWSISRSIVEKCRVPVYLAGGLNADNVRDAIAAVRPFGVDLCSSVRTDGKLDEAKLSVFFEAIHKAVG